jgi:hypothetical protein
MTVSTVTLTGWAMSGWLMTAVLRTTPSSSGDTATLKLMTTEASKPTSPCQVKVLPVTSGGGSTLAWPSSL